MAKIFNLFAWKRRRMEHELDRELRYHVDRRVDDLVRSGLSEADAKRRATLELGGLAQVQEGVRDAWMWRWLDNRRRDLRYGARTLVRSPGFTATAMLSLVLGVGVNTAIFSLVDQVLLRRLPVKDADRLVHLDWVGNSLSSVWGTGHLMSYPLCRDFEKQAQFFDGVFCRHPTTVHLSTGKQHDPVPAEIVSGSYFSVLGARPEFGRLISASDDLQPGAHAVVVLSHDYWQHNLGGATDVVGKNVLVNNFPMTVIGIAPARFPGVNPLQVPAVWIPAMMKRQATPEWDRLLDRRAAWMHVFGRLKPGVTADEARLGLLPWFKSMLEADTGLEGFPRVTAEQRANFLASTIDVLPTPRGVSDLRGALQRPLWVLFGGTALLLLLASLNVAGLLLARGAARGRELSTRVALGASRSRITGQLLVEGLLVTVTGGLLGLVVAPAGSRFLLSFLLEDGDLGARIDGRVFLFALLVSVVTGALCSIAPALQAGRSSLISSIKRQSNVAGGAVRLRKTIVVAQLAFTLLLLIGAGLFVQTLARLHGKDLGVARSHLVMFRIEPDAIGYSAADAPQLMRGLLEKLQGLPGVDAASVANSQMLSGGSPRRILTIQSDARLVTDRALPMMRVGPAFFATMGTPVIAGRDFNESDTRDIDKTGYRSIIVNESFARRYFGGRSPIGYRVGVGNQPNTPTPIEIVGMIRDFSFRVVRDDQEPEHVFFPFAQTGPLAGNGTFYLKVRGEPESAFTSIRAAVAEMDPRLPPVSLRALRRGRVRRPDDRARERCAGARGGRRGDDPRVARRVGESDRGAAIRIRRLSGGSVSAQRASAGTRPSLRRCEPAGRRRPGPGGSTSCPRSPGTAPAR